MKESISINDMDVPVMIHDCAITKNYVLVLDFPLTIRRWQPGDIFQPLGLGGHRQKIQDFFSNNKVSRFAKEQAWILEDANQNICWLVGYRIGEGVKIKADTKGYWVLSFQAGGL